MTKFRFTIILCALAALLGACNSNDAGTAEEKLLTYADAECPIVAVADIHDIPADAQAPQWLCRASGLSRADANVIFSNPHLERNTVLLRATPEENGEVSGFLVLSTSDSRKFVEAVAEDKNEEVVNVADYICVDRAGFPVVAYGAQAYVGFGPHAGDSAADLITAIEHAEADATAKPLPQWQLQRLSAKAFMTASVTADVADKLLRHSPVEGYLPALPSSARLFISLKEDGQTATLHAEALSRSGQPVALLPQKDKSGFDASLLRYASATDIFLAGAGCLQDLETAIPEASFLSSVTETLGADATGPVMIAAGPDPQDPAMALSAPSPANWHWVVAMKMTHGKAAQSLNRMARYLRFMGVVREHVEGESLSLELPVPASRMFDDDINVPVCLTVNGDVLVADGGIQAAESPCTLNGKLLADKQLGAVAAIGAKSPLLQGLGLGFGLTADAIMEGNTLTINLTVTDTNLTIRQAFNSVLGDK